MAPKVPSKVQRRGKHGESPAKPSPGVAAKEAAAAEDARMDLATTHPIGRVIGRTHFRSGEDWVRVVYPDGVVEEFGPMAHVVPPALQQPQELASEESQPRTASPPIGDNFEEALRVLARAASARLGEVVAEALRRRPVGTGPR